MNFNDLSILGKYARDYGYKRIKSAGINHTEHRICAFLYEHDGVSQDTVASVLMLDKTTVAKSLLSLENRGFIKRVQNPKNRRKNIISITDECKDKISDIRYIYDEWFLEIFSCMTEEEKKQFGMLFNRIMDRAKELVEEESI